MRSYSQGEASAMQRFQVGLLVGAVFCFGLMVSDAPAFQTENATYVGSDVCLGCHSSAQVQGAQNMSGWKETLHANIYREPTVETVIGDCGAMTGSV